jgi:hypothetical protein
MKQIIWFMVALLIIFHQDFWNWRSDQNVYGIMPIGLMYHIWLSLAAAGVWTLACLFAWPADLAEEALPEPVEATPSKNSAGHDGGTH